MPTLWAHGGLGTYTTTSFTPAIRNAMNTAKWECDVTFSNAMTSYSGFNALIANGNGGLWIVNSQIQLYRHEDGGLVAGTGGLTGAASTAHLVVDPVARTFTVSGLPNGNGTFSWAVGTTTLFDSGSVGVLQYTDGSYGPTAATISAISDFVVSLTGDAAITLGAAAVAATGAIEMVGDGAITLGALTVAGADVPRGDATLTLDALTVAGTATVEMVGVGAITLGGIAVSSTATGPAAWSVGASTVKQRYNANGPSTGTLTTDAVSTTTGSILIAFVARGKWDSAADPKSPTDSEGNTWTQINLSNYSGYPDSQFGVWWCVNVNGSASHTFSATWGPYGTGAPGNPGDEVTIGMFELLSGGYLQTVVSQTRVERATPTATVTGTAVTPSGPSIVVSILAGNGPVGQTHAFTLTSQAVTDGWANVAGASANGNPDPNGYIQSWPAVLIDQNGAKTNAAQNIGATGTSSEGAQVFQFVVQSAAGILGDGAITLGAVTVAGDGLFPAVGDAATTLGALAVAGTGTIDVTGAAAPQLGALTVTGTASIELVGDAALTLGAIGLSSDGSILLEGVGAITLGSLSVSGGSVAELVGDASITLGSLVVSGGVIAELTGDGAIVLGPLTVAGASLPELVGDGAIVLGALTTFGFGSGPSDAVPSTTQRLSISATWGLVRATIAADVAPTRPIITKD